MIRATQQWMEEAGSHRLGTDHQTILKKLQTSYVVYGCMVLLPSDAIIELERTGYDLQKLYQLVAKHLKITHIATTRPIPLHSESENGEIENIIRAPRNFKALYGDFGPSSCSSPPTRVDFDEAFWVTAKQNGIYQTWAPRWTMFSRGNISEKARILSLPSVASAVEEGRLDGLGCTAVDLYAGIGYFTFSYLKAGVSKVLCWDLNPWSIEGLVRGARRNKWEAVLVEHEDQEREAISREDVRLLAFCESNESAGAKIVSWRDRVPPVRHVNCGLLPSSRGSWEIAVRVLDLEQGGWIHVHENFAIDEIEQRANEVRQEIQRLVQPPHVPHAVAVEIDHINRLKSYAPGVIHCVIDIHIQGYG